MARVLDIDLFDGDIAAATRLLIDGCAPGETRLNRLVSATGAHGIVTARRDPAFRRVLRGFDLNLPDGMPGVWISRLKGDRRIQRCYGPDFLAAVMTASADLPIRHYLCGGKPGVAEELRDACRERFGNGNMGGIFSPPFREMTDAELAELASDIDAYNTDIVWVGLSTPKQEQFAARLAGYTHVHFLCTVGAAFDFHTGRVRQAPRWVQRLGLEWLFRLLIEPGRLWRRYVVVVPALIVWGAWDVLKFRLSRRAPGKPL